VPDVEINFDEFAEQVDYLGLLGKLVVPRALVFVGQENLFTGDDPFSAEELSALLPRRAYAYTDDDVPEGVAFDLVVVGQREFSKEVIVDAMARDGEPPRFLPQEGFLDELLFGHDWWYADVEWLNAVLRYHPGLQYVASLESFPWPGTEAAESEGGGEGELELRERSRLKELGYDTTKPRPVRWRVLTTKAVPELGLPKVAGMIAWFCKLKKRQRGGSQRFARAIGEWEHDLERLKRELYPQHSPRFVWPRSE